MGKGHKRKKIRWDKLDNTANLFPAIAGESRTNVYRISVTLKEDVDPVILKDALDKVLPKFDLFNVRLRSGLFWYYFEENTKPAPKVVQENTFPCRYIRQNKNRSYLFRVSYFEKRINLEVFHVLTDGMGGFSFLRELTYQYLRLRHTEINDKVKDELSAETSLNSEDSFLRHYREKKPLGFANKRAFLIKQEKLPAGEIDVIHVIMSVKQLKEICHKSELSINEFLIAAYAYSIYINCVKKKEDKPIRIAVPVDLRPYFGSTTTKNFFVVVSAELNVTDKQYTFEEVCQIIKASLKSQINKENLEELFSYSVSNQVNFWLRLVPRNLKNFCMRFVYNRSALANTTTVTNIGNLKLEDPYGDYVERFHAFITMSKGQFIKGTICSFKDTLVFSFVSGYKERNIQRGFVRTLTERGVDITIESNNI
ncbi:MAG: hypothetical protein K6F84_01175 [Lachnospiraceae bacterium]|nr:hypothetical protein [Lachnospiraceae bacterium]